MAVYEYTGLMADAWDLLRGDTSGWEDRAWFRIVVEQGGGPALDVGCGTGRLLLDYLAAGLDVDGIDISLEMIAICRAKAEATGLDVSGRLHVGAMQSLALPRRYTTIFVPSFSFLLLTMPGDAERALAAFRAHIVPGGRLALSFKSGPWWAGPEPQPPDGVWSEWEIDGEAERPDGAVVRRWTRGRIHASRQLLDEAFRYEVVRDGDVVATEHHGFTPTLRWWTLDQALVLMAEAGFTDLRATRDSSFEPARPDESRFKIVGLAP